MREAPTTRVPSAAAATPWRRVHLPVVDSTNRWLRDAAAGGAPHRTVVTADHQTAGRGRRERSWTAPPGGSLLTSVLLREPTALTARAQAVLAATVAMAEALEARSGLPVALKWPNDLLLGDRKVGGVLAEWDGAALVVGIGVNLHWARVPADLAGTATAVNLAGGRPVTPAELLEEFLRRLDAHLDALPRVLDAYRPRLATLGRRVRVELAEADRVGVAVDVDEAGRLVVAVEGGRRETVAAGDVVHLRPADG